MGSKESKKGAGPVHEQTSKCNYGNFRASMITSEQAAPVVGLFFMSSDHNANKSLKVSLRVPESRKIFITKRRPGPQKIFDAGGTRVT